MPTLFYGKLMDVGVSDSFIRARDGEWGALTGRCRSHVITVLLYQRATSWRTVFSVIFFAKSHATPLHATIYPCEIWTDRAERCSGFNTGLRRDGSLEKSVGQRRFSSGELGNFASQWPSIVKNVFACINVLILLRSSRLSQLNFRLASRRVLHGNSWRIHVKLKPRNRACEETATLCEIWTPRTTRRIFTFDAEVNWRMRHGWYFEFSFVSVRSRIFV